MSTGCSTRPPTLASLWKADCRSRSWSTRSGLRGGQRKPSAHPNAHSIRTMPYPAPRKASQGKPHRRAPIAETSPQPHRHGGDRPRPAYEPDGESDSHGCCRPRPPGYGGGTVSGLFLLTAGLLNLPTLRSLYRLRRGSPDFLRRHRPRSPRIQRRVQDDRWLAQAVAGWVRRMGRRKGMKPCGGKPSTS